MVRIAGQCLFVHRLVTAAFMGPRPHKHDVCHKDDVRHNNRVSNLWYGTRTQNLVDCIQKGRYDPKRTRGSRKVDPLQILIVRELLMSPVTYLYQKDIARLVALSTCTVGKISRRDTWRHV